MIAALIAEVLFGRWLATKWKPASSRMNVAAGIIALAGPTCGLLPYSDIVPAFPFTLPVVWILAAIGAVGIGVGVFALRTGSKVAGVICILTNLPVFAYWGFVGAFFSMGGSR